LSYVDKTAIIRLFENNLMTPFWLISAALAAMPIPDEAVRASIEKGVKRLEISASSYVTKRSCFSCHHQAVPMLALASAKERGFAIDAKVFDKQTQFTADFFKNKIKEIREGRGIGGANTTAVYALLALRVAKHERDRTTDALVEFLVKKQQKDGSWTPTTARPPSEGSTFTTGALALQALQHYEPLADDCDPDGLRVKVSDAREKALAHLQKAKPQTMEDRVFLLWGLVAGGAAEKDIAKARDELLKLQRSNGGWAQLDDMKSDAYATGSALFALRMAGVSPKDEAYRRGVRFLVLSQHESGMWIVTTRSKPIQTYFDNGDAGGKSQFISIAATAWAVAALAETCEKK
jgi:N-acyl-D-amino-acid deacylase